jgi:hypothetical protein
MFRRVDGEAEIIWTRRSRAMLNSLRRESRIGEGLADGIRCARGVWSCCRSSTSRCDAGSSTCHSDASAAEGDDRMYSRPGPAVSRVSHSRCYSGL